MCVGGGGVWGGGVRDRQTDQTDRWTETGKSFYRCFVKAILLILWLSSLRHSHEKYLGFCNEFFVVCFFDRLNVLGKTFFFFFFFSNTV